MSASSSSSSDTNCEKTTVERPDQTVIGAVLDGSRGLWSVTCELSDVSVKPAGEQAAVCSALGCRTGGDLAHVQVPRVGDRVLCREHTFEIIRQERAAEVDEE